MAPAAKCKKNVRIDTLPTDRRTATKDCRQCTKRRIRCDRTVPHCQKCTIRELPCPGFLRLQLKWGQGVASRGHFRGKSLPVTNTTESSEDVADAHKSVVSSNPSRVSLMRDQDLMKRNISLTLNENLLRHFFSTVVSHLTWLDSGPCNPWRSLVQPLVPRSDFLRLSVCGLASAHLSATLSDEAQSSLFLQVNHRIRNETMMKVSNRMRLELCASPSSSQSGFYDLSLSEMLACTLLLCYSELHIPSSPNWGLHLRACRAIVERRYLRSQRDQPQDALSRFLIKEVADLETFGSLAGSRSLDGAGMGVDWESFLNGNPWTFTALINEITATERLYSGCKEHSQSPGQSNMKEWHDKLGAAYHRATEMVATLPECHAIQRIFRTIIDAHYYATLVYSYQCLAPQPEHTQKVNEYCDIIWQILQSVTESSYPAFIHDVFFPLFIVGTQCLYDAQRQSQIEMVWLRSISATGFWCNQTALHMLRLFWKESVPGSNENWIQFARKNEALIGPFVIF